MVRLLCSIEGICNFAGCQLISFVRCVRSVYGIRRIDSIGRHVSIVPLCTGPGTSVCSLTTTSSESSCFDFCATVAVRNLALRLPGRVCVAGRHGDCVGCSGALGRRTVSATFDGGPERAAGVEAVRGCGLRLVGNRSGGELNMIPFHGYCFIASIREAVLSSMTEPFCSNNMARILRTVVGTGGMVSISGLICCCGRVRCVCPCRRTLNFCLRGTKCRGRTLIPFLGVGRIRGFCLACGVEFARFSPH